MVSYVTVAHNSAMAPHFTTEESTSLYNALQCPTWPGPPWPCLLLFLSHTLLQVLWPPGCSLYVPGSLAPLGQCPIFLPGRLCPWISACFKKTSFKFLLTSHLLNATTLFTIAPVSLSNPPSLSLCSACLPSLLFPSSILTHLNWNVSTVRTGILVFYCIPDF